MARRVFEARYYGRCPECNEEIDPGDQVVYNDDDLVVHEDCYDGEVYE